MIKILFKDFIRLYDPLAACKLSFKAIGTIILHSVRDAYRDQGVQIADKHLELIVSQMINKVRIEHPGSTRFLPGELVEVRKLAYLLEVSTLNNETPPTFIPVLLGITKASLLSGSFISSASFQHTTKVLIDSAVGGRKDWLYGLKENVITSRLIPAGTGFDKRSMLQSVFLSRRQRNKMANFFLSVPNS